MSARRHLDIRGLVQGVGFRPYVHRLASSLGLSGWVRNGPGGASCEVEGEPAALDAFRERLPLGLPPRARIDAVDERDAGPLGARGFEILASRAGTALVPPDAAPCADCLRELRDPADRRYRHPFINCTACGPRFSILESLPWDRAGTTMRDFPLCAVCRREYADPADRRFHAEPVACFACGPTLRLDGARGDAALSTALEALRDGRIAAVKGVGGFHLAVDARDEDAVRRLRTRKARDEKPFAVLVPDLDAARRLALLDPVEEALLESPGRPVVIVRRRDDGLAPSVAPGLPWIGLLLPQGPLHVLLADRPLVATSANLSEEPICTDDDEARTRLAGIADLVLGHDRRIVRPLEDSVVRVIDGAPCFLRRGRGHAPYAVGLPRPLPAALALGGQVKGSVAVTTAGSVQVAPHLGDVATEGGFARLLEAARDLPALAGLEPGLLLHDSHPDYRTTRHAAADGRPARAVQHHAAHLFAGLLEHGLEPPATGVIWDGTGWGPDGTVWGGETLLAEAGGIRRIAHLRTFALPGGEAAVREPRRAALGVLAELFGTEPPPVPGLEASERGVLLSMIARGVNSPRTSSAGRLFDAAAALCGLRARCSHEAQAAMAFEAAVDPGGQGRYDVGPDGDWGPMIHGLLADLSRGEPVGRIAARVHASLAEFVVQGARAAATRDVVLSGGCFQNRVLAETAARRLREEGFRPFLHREIPPNDGGLAAGQAASLLWS